MGLTEYSADTILDWVSEQEEPTEDIHIDGFNCSSSEIVNSVFEDLGQTVSDEQGLKHLTIELFYDKNELQEWPLGQLALKCHSLQSLNFTGFKAASAANRSRLLEFAGRAITSSRCFNTLNIYKTGSSVSDGA